MGGWDIRNHEMFHSKAIKNHACNPNMLFDSSNDRKYQKVIGNGLQRGPKIHQKPEQQGNGKRGVHNQAQQQCTPSYS